MPPDNGLQCRKHTQPKMTRRSFPSMSQHCKGYSPTGQFSQLQTDNSLHHTPGKLRSSLLPAPLRTYQQDTQYSQRMLSSPSQIGRFRLHNGCTDLLKSSQLEKNTSRRYKAGSQSLQLRLLTTRTCPLHTANRHYNSLRLPAVNMSRQYKVNMLPGKTFQCRSGSVQQNSLSKMYQTERQSL